MNNNKSYLIILLIICSFTFINQTAVSQNLSLSDSLKTLLKSAEEDSTKIKHLTELGSLTEATNPDTSVHYFHLALKLAKESSDEILISKCYNALGLFYSGNGNYDLAIDCFKSLLKTYENKNKFIEIAYCYLNIGEIFINKGNYPVSLEWIQKALKIFEKSSNSDDLNTSLSGKKGMVRCFNSIGRVHADNGNFDQAADYFQKAVTIEKQVGDKRVLSGCYNNIGIIYYMQSKFTQAIEYYQKSLRMAEEINDKQGMSERYNNIGLVYADNGNPEMAIDFYMKSYNIDKELGDQKGMSIVLGNVSLLKIQCKKYKEAIAYSEKSLEIAKKIGSLDEEKSAYGYLAAAYDSIHDYRQTSKYLKLYKLFNDSLFNIESSKQIKEIEAVYQTEKKQKEIELLNKDKELQKAEISKQEMQKYGFITGFIFMLFLSVVIFRSYSQKKRANAILTKQKILIEEKNEELNQQNEEISAQRDEIETQRDLVVFQKEKIEEILAGQTSSIHYAKRIQKAVLPDKEMIDTFLTDHFILFKPRDIVSGDFYWMTMRKNFLMVAVADCTGHGVPGAFMSMLGISFLNEIVTHEDVNQASQVLNKLRVYVLKSLQQKGLSYEQQDGMDIVFIIINMNSVHSDSGPEQFEVQFSGANNPLYLVASRQLSVGSQQSYNCVLPTADCRLFEIKGDKMPVSIYRNMPDFTNHELMLRKGDIIYLCSDGFSDQFGGPKERKFLSGNFIRLLHDHCNLPMDKQKQILNETIENWMSGFDKKHEQTDDITVFGIQL